MGKKYLSPKISVVMAVYNGGDCLEISVRGILDQTFEDFEFIIIDDGSTDGSEQVLRQYAIADDRIQLHRQENTGLTRALIKGCSVSKGEFIARQDGGDVSLPERLEIQSRFLSERPNAVMVGCGVESVTPVGEVLYSNTSPGDVLDRGLRELSVTRIKGPPHHGGTMYRRDSYLRCGGYRPQFRVAQDIDLWLRLSELGDCLGNEEILYRAGIEPGSISTTLGPDQFYFGDLAIKSAKLRRAGKDDAFLFEDLAPPSTRRNPGEPVNEADYYYFVGSTLTDSNRTAARAYLDKALKHNPFHLKARLRRMVLGRR